MTTTQTEKSPRQQYKDAQVTAAAMRAEAHRLRLRADEIEDEAYEKFAEWENGVGYSRADVEIAFGIGEDR